MNTKNDISIENDDTRIGKIEQVLPPIALLEKYPASNVAVKTVEMPVTKRIRLFMAKMIVYLW